MFRITGKQCKAARSLLKWNLQDLASRVRVEIKRIESFESGNVPLHAWEMEELVKCFKDKGCIFRSDLSVALNTYKSGVGEAIVINDKELQDITTNSLLAGQDSSDRKRGDSDEPEIRSTGSS
jgi:CDP-glycerol glycerophosphotransferase (TagB/SpsB family)